MSITVSTLRRYALALLAVGLGALALGACGSDSGSATTTPSARGARGGRGFAQDPKVRACLEKQGVTLPTGRRGGGPRAGGARPYGAPPPTGTNTVPPRTGTTARRPPGGGRDPAQFAKLRAALKKCGAQTPSGRPGGAPVQTTPNAAAS